MSKENEQKRSAQIGVFGIGLAAYWPQFEGLRERLIGYQDEVERRIIEMGADVISAGLVDTAPTAQEAGELFAGRNVDLIVCYVGTYSTSSQVLPAVQRHRAPVLVLNLQPVAALDYEGTDTAEWLANCCACCVPEISNAFARSRIQFNVVSGLLFPAEGRALHAYERGWNEIEEWVFAADIKRELSYARVGFLGHTYPGMLDMYSDFTMFHAQLGAHIEVLEMDDLHQRVHGVNPDEIDAKVEEINDTFDIAELGKDAISQPVTEDALRWSAQVAVGLDKLVSDFDLNGLTYYYRGLDGNENETLGSTLIVGNSLLTARGVPASGEGDLKTCLAMLMMDRLGSGGSFTEFYAMDFNEDFILMGHDGPGHIAISAQRPLLRGLGLFHGKRGYGLSVEFNVRNGPVTILGLTQTADGRFKLIAAEGECIPGPRMAIGNTNSRLDFGQNPAPFMDAWCANGPTHHVALGIGHRLGTIRKLARLLDIELAVIR